MTTPVLIFQTHPSLQGFIFLHIGGFDITFDVSCALTLSFWSFLSLDAGAVFCLIQMVWVGRKIPNLAYIKKLVAKMAYVYTKFTHLQHEVLLCPTQTGLLQDNSDPHVSNPPSLQGFIFLHIGGFDITFDVSCALTLSFWSFLSLDAGAIFCLSDLSCLLHRKDQFLRLVQQGTS